MQDSPFNKTKPVPSSPVSLITSYLDHPHSRVRWKKGSIEIEIEESDGKSDRARLADANPQSELPSSDQNQPSPTLPPIYIFKQLPESSKLLQSIPLQFRKKVR